MAGAFTPLAATASFKTRRWLTTNSENTSAFAVIAVVTGQAAFETSYSGKVINTCATPGMSLFGAAKQRLQDFLFNAKQAQNMAIINFCLVGNDDTTADFKITGFQEGKLPSSPTAAQDTRLVPTPLCTGSLIRGTKATASGVANEGYADTITINTTTQQFVPLQVYTAATQTGLANDIGTLIMSTIGYEWLLLEMRFSGGGAATSGNAEVRFI